MGKWLLLLFLWRGGGSLRGLSLGHALLEFIHTPGGIDEFLLTGVKRVAHVTNTHDDHGLGRACLDHIAARATDLGVHILRMYICFHKRLEKIALIAAMTSLKWETCNSLSINPQHSTHRENSIFKPQKAALIAWSWS